MVNVLRVESVNPTGKAFKAGIQKDDLLVSYNGSPLEATEALISLASASNENENRLELIRGQAHKVVVVSGGALGISVVPKEIHGDVLSAALFSSGDAIRKLELSDETPEERLSRAREMILTTAPTIEGYRVVETLEIVSAECAYGMNFFKDFFASVRDVVGGRSKAIQGVLKDARRECLTELKREALDVGANAVIAVKLDYSEFSGKENGMLFLVASGTAVKVEKINEFASPDGT